MPRPYRSLFSISNSSSSSSFDQTAAEPPEAVTIESDFVVILAALLCALICILGLLAVARCAWLRRGSTNRNPVQPAANKGMKKKALQSLPKLIYKSNENENENRKECAICLAEYVEGEEIRVLPQCGHGFHVGCIDVWLASHSSCPSCRQVLVVARCRKCGEFPSFSVAETERKDGGGHAGSSSCSSDYLP